MGLRVVLIVIATGRSEVHLEVDVKQLGGVAAVTEDL
jgi:hypothetical protein